jgi:chaperone BCS1
VILDLSENSVILFEDIDCMKAGNRRGISPRGGTNSNPRWALERVVRQPALASPSQGCSMFSMAFTRRRMWFQWWPRKVEALDPALLRPGCIDYRLLMGEASESQRIELYRRIFPEATGAEAKDFA